MRSHYGEKFEDEHYLEANNWNIKSGRDTSHSVCKSKPEIFPKLSNSTPH